MNMRLEPIVPDRIQITDNCTIFTDFEVINN